MIQAFAFVKRFQEKFLEMTTFTAIMIKLNSLCCHYIILLIIFKNLQKVLLKLLFFSKRALKIKLVTEI